MALDKITSDSIAPGAVNASAMPDGAITAAKLHTTAITDKLGFNPVSPTELATKADASATTAALATKADSSSLTNVENKSSATIRSEITSSNVTTALGFTPYNSSNPNGYINSINSTNVTNALGFTPYNSSNPSGYISNVTTALGYTPVSPTDLSTSVNTAVSNLVGAAPAALNTLVELSAALGNDANYASTVTSALATKANAASFSNVENKSSATIRSEITSGNVTTALGFTPYNSTNPNGYITGITSSNVTTALGFTPYNSTNPSGYITGITSGNVTTALGYTPYNSSNPSGYLTTTSVSPTDVSDKTNTSTGYFDLPTGTLAQRPASPTSGNTRFNTTANAVEVYTGATWSLIGAKDGSSYAAAATSATAIWDLGIRGKGLFWVQRADGSPVQTYCDLDTLGQDGKGGWMLVGSWATASEWTKDSVSSNAAFGATALNCFSSNFGNNTMTHMRVKVATSIDLASASSDADFYYYWSSPIQWKTVWAAGAGTNNHYNSGTVNAGGSVPRNSLRQFSYAYNLKFGYTANYQTWANLSDSGTSGPGTGSEEWRDWYSGLTTPGITLGANMRGDGSLAITFGGDTSTGAGQDTNNQNAKYGYDDTGVCAWGGTTGTNNMGANTGTQGNNTNLWMWIK